MFARSTSIYTVFVKNVNSSNGMMVTNTSQDQTQVDKYVNLAKVVNTVNVLMTEYAKGHFYEVANILTPGTYNNLSIKFANLAADPIKYPEYETIRKSSTSALAGLYQSILQYSNYVNIEAQLALAQELVNILNDPVLLNQYILKLRQKRQLFPDSKVQVTAATLKPEYAEYVRLYGFPAGAIFETDKLAGILQKISQ
jgi:hypothetical protein